MSAPRIGAMAAALFIVLAPASAAAQGGELEFLEPEEVVVTAEPGASENFTVRLRNRSPQQVTPTFAAEVEDEDGRAIAGHRVVVVVVDDDDKEIATAPIGENDVGRYRLFLRGQGIGEEVSGLLVARGPRGVAPATVPLSAAPPTVADRGADVVILGSLLLAAAIMAVARRTVATGPLSGALPDLKFDFKGSYASTLTGVSALLGAVLSAGVLDDPANLTTKAYAALNVLFFVLVAAGTFAYAVVLAPKLWSFLLASFLTVWAVYGELWTLYLLVDDLGRPEGFPSIAVSLLKLVFVAAALGALAYVFRKIQAVVQGTAVDAPAAQTQVAATAERPAPVAAGARARRLSLL